MLMDTNGNTKELLIKDLSSRLPYGVKIELIWWGMGEGAYTNTTLEPDHIEQLLKDEDGDIEIKPYLFPLSSMTEEQKKEISKRYNLHTYYGLYIEITNHSEGYWDDDNSCNLQDYLWLVDWFNKNHFDYRGLIEKGLAIDATGLNIY